MALVRRLPATEGRSESPWEKRANTRHLSIIVSFFTVHSVRRYLSVAFLDFHSRVLGQQLLPKVPDKRSSLAASPSYYFSPTCQRSWRKNFFVGNPIHENIMTRKFKTRKYYYTKISRYTVEQAVSILLFVIISTFLVNCLWNCISARLMSYEKQKLSLSGHNLDVWRSGTFPSKPQGLV